MPESLANQIAGNASRDELLKSIRASQCRLGMEPKEWLAAVSSLQPLFPSDLAWLTLSDRRRILSVAKECIKDALTQFFPSREHIAEDDLKPALDPFVTWLESSSDDDILRFSWDLIAWRTQLGWTDSWYPVRRMERSGRLAGAISREHIETAVTIVEEAHCIRSWPKNRWQFVHWDSHAETYFKSLEDPSYLVRAASAHALGALLCGCHSEGNGCGAPTGSEMLDFVQKQEQKRPGVAGPFLTGANWLAYIFDNQWLTPTAYDMRAWFLETLRSSSREPNVPHLIPLEFWAHEFFSCDAAAIEEILNMGREHLAVLTATEEPECIDRLLPLLTKMSQSSNPRIAGAIQIYLKERVSHAGMRFFNGDDQ